MFPQTEIEDFRKYWRRRRPGRSTAIHYSSDVTIFIKWAHGHSPESVTARDVDRFVEWQHSLGRAPATITRRLIALRRFYDYWAYAHDQARPNPVIPHRHYVARGDPLPHDVREEVIERLWDAIGNHLRDRTLFTLMLHAGLRVSEAAQLCVSEVELTNDHHPHLRLKGKGQRERLVYLSARAAQHLREYLATRPADGAERVFLNRRGQPLTVTGIQWQLAQYCRRAGIWVTCHQLRHTFASRLMAAEVPITSLQKLLGHTSLRTTQLYVRLADAQVERDYHAGIRRVLGGGASIIPALVNSDWSVVTAPEPRVGRPWPENEQCSRQFQAWLLANGYSTFGVQGNYFCAARWALQRLPQPHWALEPEELITQARVDLEQRADLSALTKRGYAKGLKKLLEFLLFRRGREVSSSDPLALPPELDAWPAWLSRPLGHYLRVQQRQWPERTVREQTRGAFHRLTGLCRFFAARYAWSNWSELTPRWIDESIDTGLRQGLSPSTLNGRLMAWQSFCRFLLEEGYPVPATFIHLELLETPHGLPRPLSNAQVRRLESCIQSAIAEASTEWRRQQATMDLAWFHLLWHCGLRLSEVRYLRHQDVNLEDRKLFIRAGKGRKDRVVYLSDTAVHALRQHLATRAEADQAYVFTRHQRVLLRGLVEYRLRVYGQQVGVEVTPHRLRHTFASQMLAAGMPVTSLQRYLGHEKIDTTMIYAAVSDPLLERDYYRGIVTVDPASAALAPDAGEASRQADLRRWMVQLKEPSLTTASRNKILEQMQRLLDEPSGSKAKDR